jgi:hypothetical protein
MTKQPVKKTPKTKTVKKTKAKQIIKQKVVVNVAAAPRRRGRPRKSSESERRGPVPKGETVLISKAAEKQYYDAERAGKKYADEMKKELLEWKANQENETKKNLGMQQLALFNQMRYQQAQQQPEQGEQTQSSGPTIEILPNEPTIEDVILDAALTKAKKTKQESLELARAAKAQKAADRKAEAAAAAAAPAQPSPPPPRPSLSKREARQAAKEEARQAAAQKAFDEALQKVEEIKPKTGSKKKGNK